MKGLKFPCGRGLEYLHRSTASRGRRRKGNPVPGGITAPPCRWGDINTWTWSSRLGLDKRLTTFLCKKIIVTKSKEVKTG
jgi:hypothetical protein